MGNFGQSLHVVQVVAADVGIEKHRGAVGVLAADSVFKIPADGIRSLRQAGLSIDRVALR